jgi:PKD repeat protein
VLLGTTNANDLVAKITPKAKALVKPKAEAEPATRSIFPTETMKREATPATGGPLTGVGPYNVVFDGSQSTDNPNSIASWTLDFGDGSHTSGTGTPPHAKNHTYASVGSYTAQLHVVDQSSIATDDTIVVNVTPAPPKVWLMGDQPLGFEKLTEKFDASQSSPGNWTISWGDGTKTAHGTGTPPSAQKHTYKHVGIYTAVLTVTDPATGLSSVARAVSTVSASRKPSATTKVPDVGQTSAHLLTDIWTNGKPTSYHFEWGTAPNQLTHITPTKVARMGASSPATAISGLTQGAHYFYRVVASNSVGTTVGDIVAFSPSTGPKVTLANAKSITSSSAILSGTVNPAGSPATAHFEWGLGSTIDQITPGQDMGSGKAKQPISVTISGLAADTTYSYRLVSVNGVGQTATAIKTFTTKPGPGVVAATVLARTAAPVSALPRSTVRY